MTYPVTACVHIEVPGTAGAQPLGMMLIDPLSSKIA
jgi:hypothetical protein